MRRMQRDDCSALLPISRLAHVDQFNVLLSARSVASSSSKPVDCSRSNCSDEKSSGDGVVAAGAGGVDSVEVCGALLTITTGFSVVVVVGAGSGTGGNDNTGSISSTTRSIFMASATTWPLARFVS